MSNAAFSRNEILSLNNTSAWWEAETLCQQCQANMESAHANLKRRRDDMDVLTPQSFNQR